MHHALDTESAGVVTATNEIAFLSLQGYGGGSLPYGKGQALVKAGVKLRCTYGGTEISPVAYAYLRDDSEHSDWDYIRFSERVDIDWVPQGNGTFELIIRSSDEYYVAIDNTGLEGVSGCATSDLWAPHPTKPDRFKCGTCRRCYCARPRQESGAETDRGCII